MKRLVLASLAAIAVSAPALAQTTGVAPPGATIVVEPAQRAKIKEYIVERKPRPITLKERVVVGMALPSDVELAAVPTDWGPELTRYRYVYYDDHVVLVEPASRKVVQIIE